MNQKIAQNLIDPGGPLTMNPDELDEECRELINIIAAEFESDPMSVQCFDKRIVDRAIEAAKNHRRYREPLF